jgi:NMD protein affecting ribosome stability and mRNA decay
VHEHDRYERHSLLCPQCGCPNEGFPTASGRRSSFCEDCVGDREIDEAPPSGHDLPENPPL